MGYVKIMCDDCRLPMGMAKTPFKPWNESKDKWKVTDFEHYCQNCWEAYKK